MKVSTNRIMFLEKNKLVILLLSFSVLFVLSTNALFIGSFYKCYGIAGHSIAVSIILALVLSICIKNKTNLLVMAFGYILTALPVYYISTATHYSGREIKVHNRIIVDGNLSAILIACALILLSVYIVKLKNNKARNISISLISLIWSVGLVQFVAIVFYGVNYGKGPTGPALFAILQTNPREAYEYLLSQGEFVLFLAILALSFLPIYCYLIVVLYKKSAKKTTQTDNSSSDNKLSFLAFILILISFSTLNLENAYNPYVSTAITFYQQRDYKNTIDARNDMLEALNLKEIQSNEGLYVVIIGESLTRDHMSVYGYDRLTTPWQNKALAESGFYKFENPYSCHVVSAFSLSMVLTSMSQYDTKQRNMAECPSIIEIARAAGYDVTWLSNHAYYGLTSKPHNVIATASDNKVWINQYNNDVSFKTEYYDDELLVELRKYLNSDKKKRIIFLHLFGNHGEYAQRYPKEFSKWNDSGMSDTYDNSIIYNDFVVSEIFNIVKTNSDLKAVMYFSDHGEQMGVGHTPDAFTYTMARIPFWIYLSDDYRREHPEVASAIESNIKRPFTNDLVFDIICGLTGITDHPYYSSNNDITSGDFSLKPDDVVIFNTYKAVEDKNYIR